MLTKADLRSYQHRAVTALYESDGILAVLDMGAGKTATALTAFDELRSNGLRRHALTVAPKRVAQLVWPREIGDWEHLKGLRYALLDGEPKSRKHLLAEAENRDVTIVGIDNVQWLCDELEGFPDDHPIFDLLIIDETSRLRNPKSKRAKALIGLMSRFKTIWGLTGTPRPNGYQDLFKPMQIITRNALWGRSFYRWRDEQFYPTDYQRRDWQIKPEWERPTIDQAAAHSFTLAEGDMPDLPELSIVEHWVQLDPVSRAAYKRMARDLFAQVTDIDNAGEDEILAASEGVATGKLAQMAQGYVYGEGGKDQVTTLHTAKQDWIVDIVEAMAGAPLIIVYEFREDLAVLRRLFGDDLPYLGAGVSDANAARYVDDWDKGRLPLFAMHAASGGHGLNLQRGGSQIAWYGLTWSAELWEQTIKRIHRPGQTQRCFVHVCLAADTVDVAKRARVIEKLTMAEAFRRFLKTI